MKTNKELLIVCSIMVLAILVVFLAVPAKKEYVLVTTTTTTTDKIVQDCPAPQVITQTIVKEVPKETIKEVIREVVKEVPVEKIVYRDKVIYQVSDQDCRLELLTCNSVRADIFSLYTQTDKSLKSYQATTTELKTAYKELYTRYESLLNLTKSLNSQYIFSYPLTEQLVPYADFLTATSTWKFIK